MLARDLGQLRANALRASDYPIVPSRVRDAANAVFSKNNGSAHATSTEELRQCADLGISMLVRGLSIRGDPMQMRPKLSEKVNTYIGHLVKRIARQREAAEAEKRREAERREREKRLEEQAVLDELARKRRKLSTGGMIVLVLLLMSTFAMAFGQ